MGVTYESDLDCDTSEGLHYTWTLSDCGGQLLSLPLIDTHRQSLQLPAHLLHYGSYTATARVHCIYNLLNLYRTKRLAQAETVVVCLQVQVVGSVVYSNYSVKVQVVPSPPVAFIQGGTNIFINNRKPSVVSLDGRRSYDPDTESPLRYGNLHLKGTD